VKANGSLNERRRRNCKIFVFVTRGVFKERQKDENLTFFNSFLHKNGVVLVIDLKKTCNYNLQTKKLDVEV